MRRLLAITSLLAACSSEPAPVESDAGEKTCMNTSCVAGASCVAADGSTCRCYETGVWTCRRESLGGGEFALDTGMSSPSVDARVAPDAVPDSGSSRDLVGCGTVDACLGEDPFAGAASTLEELMMHCGAWCFDVRLSSGADGCARRLVATRSIGAVGALDCLAETVSGYRWSCATTLRVVTRTCPD